MTPLLSVPTRRRRRRAATSWKVGCSTAENSGPSQAVSPAAAPPVPLASAVQVPLASAIPPEALVSNQSMRTPRETVSCTAPPIQPIATIPSLSNNVTVYPMLLDPVQVAIDTFDSIATTAFFSPSPQFMAVRAHIFKAMFRQAINAQLSNYPTPLSPADMINLTIATLTSLGLIV